jgi:hypothetical protein
MGGKIIEASLGHVSRRSIWITGGRHGSWPGEDLTQPITALSSSVVSHARKPAVTASINVLFRALESSCFT